MQLALDTAIYMIGRDTIVMELTNLGDTFLAPGDVVKVVFVQLAEAGVFVTVEDNGALHNLTLQQFMDACMMAG